MRWFSNSCSTQNACLHSESQVGDIVVKCQPFSETYVSEVYIQQRFEFLHRFGLDDVFWQTVPGVYNPPLETQGVWDFLQIRYHEFVPVPTCGAWYSQVE
ncbi:unnamed protein product [Dicrocoelium dendriticum]|nr:unnamed protein product [Dicrocoelium dendriticum]